MSGPALMFVHGWGFDAGMWAPLRAALADRPAEAVDLGYFGAARAVRPQGPVLLVAHSLGAMLALRDPPPVCLGLVAINGFDRFAEGPDWPGVRKRVIAHMAARFERSPREVIAEFRRRCGSDEEFETPVVPRLADHLRRLHDGDERHRSAAWQAPLLALHGEADPILPAGLRDAAFGSARQIERRSHPGAGHLLPQSHPEWCAGHIRNLLESLS